MGNSEKTNKGYLHLAGKANSPTSSSLRLRKIIENMRSRTYVQKHGDFLVSGVLYEPEIYRI